MARIYADENFPLPVVLELRRLGHDVITTHEAGKSDQAISDQEVLQFASAEKRIVLTFNRLHFIRLHQARPSHFGIIVCTFDPNFVALAGRINAVLQAEPICSNLLIRVKRPIL